MQTKTARLRGVRKDSANRHGQGNPLRLLITGKETEGRFSVLETLVVRGEEPPLHTHTREDELVYVLEGEVTFYKDGNRLECGVGDYVFLPKRCEHAYCIESEEARLLVLLLPAGLEGYYRELESSVGADQYVERLISLSARYGVAITGPGPPEGQTSSRNAKRGGGDGSAR